MLFFSKQTSCRKIEKMSSAKFKIVIARFISHPKAGKPLPDFLYRDSVEAI